MKENYCGYADEIVDYPAEGEGEKIFCEGIKATPRCYRGVLSLDIA